MRLVFKVDGLKALEGALADLPKRTAKSSIRRAALQALEPVMEAARQAVPVSSGKLRDSIVATTKLSKRQQRLQRSYYGKMMANGRNEGRMNFEVFGGAGAMPHAHLIEFGTSKTAARPFLRPAWDANKETVLEDFKNKLWKEIAKAAARVARKNAKAAAKG